MSLKDVRVKKGYTQEQLAEAVGVVRQTISNIECGLAKPSIETAKRLAEILEVNWTDFYE